MASAYPRPGRTPGISGDGKALYRALDFLEPQGVAHVTVPDFRSLVRPFRPARRDCRAIAAGPAAGSGGRAGQAVAVQMVEHCPPQGRADRRAGRRVCRGQAAVRRRHARCDGRHAQAPARQAGAKRHPLVVPPDDPGTVRIDPHARQGLGADTVPLRCFKCFLRAVAGPAPRLFMRLLPRQRHDPGAGAASQARPHLPQADAQAWRAFPGHRRRLGRAAAVGCRALQR